VTGAGWVRQLPPAWAGPFDFRPSSIVWGGDFLGRLDTDGTGAQLDALPDSTYYLVAPDVKGGRVGFVRSTSFKPAAKAFDIDLVSGEFHEVEPPPRSDRPLPAGAPSRPNRGVSVPTSACRSVSNVDIPTVSPDGRLAVSKLSTCDRGLFLVDVGSATGVFLARSGMCLLDQDNTDIEWLDNTRIRVITYHACL
jgi:hypothetical protein